MSNNDQPPISANTDASEQSQQDRTIAQLLTDGWIVVQPQPPVKDGSVLLQLTTPQGVSHIIVMLNGDRVDARQRLGKEPAVPSTGAP
jgi:hypothetical protein